MRARTIPNCATSSNPSSRLMKLPESSLPRPPWMVMPQSLAMIISLPSPAQTDLIIVSFAICRPWPRSAHRSPSARRYSCTRINPAVLAWRRGCSRSTRVCWRPPAKSWSAAPAAPDAAIAVGHAHPDPLLPAQNRPDVERGAGLDQRVAWIAGQKFGAFALDRAHTHRSPSCRDD